MCSSRGLVCGSACFPQAAKSASPLKYKTAKIAKFLRPQLSRGRAGAPPRGWWPSGLASVSEARGPGLGSPLARALFFVALSWFRAAGRFLRGTAMVFCFQTLEIVAEPLGLLLKPLLARLKLPARASPNKIHGCKSLLLQLLPSRDAQLRPTTRSRNKSSGGAWSSSISKSLGLSALRAVETAPFAARRSFC